MLSLTMYVDLAATNKLKKQSGLVWTVKTGYVMNASELIKSQRHRSNMILNSDLDLPIYADVCTERCGKHYGELINCFCRKHDFLGCRVCY